MGSTGVDVQLSEAAYTAFPFSVECKNQEINKSFIKMWEQSKANSEKNDAILIISANNSPALAVMDLDYLFKVIK